MYCFCHKYCDGERPAHTIGDEWRHLFRHGNYSDGIRWAQLSLEHRCHDGEHINHCGWHIYCDSYQCSGLYGHCQRYGHRSHCSYTYCQQCDYMQWHKRHNYCYWRRYLPVEYWCYHQRYKCVSASQYDLHRHSDQCIWMYSFCERHCYSAYFTYSDRLIQ